MPWHTMPKQGSRQRRVLWLFFTVFILFVPCTVAQCLNGWWSSNGYASGIGENGLPGCTQCKKGKYTECSLTPSCHHTGQGSTQPCQSCPDGGSTASDSSNSGIRTCLCPITKYSEQQQPFIPGNLGCFDCPTGSTRYTEQYLTKIHCRCLVSLGYVGPDGGPCTQCALNQWPFLGQSIYINGEWRKHSTCQSCPFGSARVVGAYIEPGYEETVKSCLCFAGYSPRRHADGTGSCDACHANSGSSAQTEMRGNYNGHPWVQDGLPPSGSEGLIRTWCTCNPLYTQITDPQNSQRKMCVLCAAGKYKDVSGNMACSDCIAGKYSPGGLASCINCPILSTSPASSTAETSCVCNSGFVTVGTNPLVCEPCVPGKYSAATGSSTAATCLSCSSGTYSETPGSPACSLCPSGKYSAATGATTSTTCQDCPQNTTSPSGSTAVTQCGNHCPGYSIHASNPKLCYCKPGTSTTPGVWINNWCVECSSSFAISLGFHSSCYCNYGYYGPNFGPCTMCPQGKHAKTNGVTESESCQSCTNSYANSDTVAGVPAMGAGHCQCKAGYDACIKHKDAPADYPGTGCVACVAGKFKNYVNNIQLHPCAGAICSSCPAGTYIGTTGATVCQNCTTHSTQVHTTSPIGSTSFSSCTCKSGYEKVGTNPFECIALACAAGSTGPAGSCTQCVPGKYKTVSGSALCDDCLAGKYSAATGASTAATCLSCSSSTYSETAGSPACTLCPSGKYSAGTGASTSTTCQCAAGATG